MLYGAGADGILEQKVLRRSTKVRRGCKEQPRLLVLYNIPLFKALLYENIEKKPILFYNIGKVPC